MAINNIIDRIARETFQDGLDAAEGSCDDPVSLGIATAVVVALAIASPGALVVFGGARLLGCAGRAVRDGRPRHAGADA